METQLENPVIKEDAEGVALQEMAARLDRGEDVTPPVISAEQSDTRADKTEAEQTSSPDTTVDSDKPEATADRPRDAQGRFTKTVEGADIPEAERLPAEIEETRETTPEKPKETAYQRAQKEAERKERSWQQLEEEKRQVRAEAERIARERAEIEQFRQQQAQPQHQNNGKPQFTSQDYADYADECARKADEARKAGDYDEADKLAAEAVKATRVSLQAAERERTATQQDYQQQMYQHLSYDVDQVRQREPELNDPKSPLSEQMNAVLGEYGPIIDQIPVTKLPNGQVGGGITLAAEIAKLRLKSGAVSGLEKKVKELEAKLADREGRLSIGGSGPTAPSSPRKLEDMSMDELGRHLEQQAAQWDRAA